MAGKYFKKVSNGEVAALVNKVIEPDDKRYIEILNCNCQVMTFYDEALTKPKAVLLSEDKTSWCPFWALRIDMADNLYMSKKFADEKFGDKQSE